MSCIKLSLHGFALVAFSVMFLALPPKAFADCASPTGVEGEMLYNTDYKLMQFCDGTNWIGMSGTIGTTTDTRLGTLTANKWCAVNGGGTAVNCDQDAPGGTAAGTVAGAVQFRGSSAVFAADDVNLVWDDTNNRLGIGTATPASLLHVAGGIQLGDDTAACPGASDVKVGTLRVNSGALQLCQSGGWATVGGGVPAGTIAAFASSTCPTGWTEYVASRGRFLRGIDNGAGNDPDGTRAPGSTQADDFKSHNHGVTDPGHIHPINVGAGTAVGVPYVASGSSSSGTANTTVTYSVTTGVTINNSGGAEARPKNVAVTFCQYQGGAPLVATPSGDAGEIQYSDGSGGLTSDANIVVSSGNVGIGTTSPGEKLSIAGEARVTGNGVWSTLGWTKGLIMPQARNILWEYSGSGQARSIGASSNGVLYIGRAPGNDNLAAGVYDMVVDNTGRVGIGTPTPSAKLDIANDASLIEVALSGAGAASNIYSSGSALFINTAAASPIFLGANGSGTQHLTILSSGNVGIGTTTPQSLLHVAGGIQLGDDTATCPGASNVKVGTMRFNGGNLEVCKTTGWSATGGAITALDDVGDVSVASVSSGQVLGWNGSNWVPYSVQLADLLVPQNTGTLIGDMTAGGGLASAFDGNTNQAYLSSAYRGVANAVGYVGKDWGLGNTKTITKVIAYGTSDHGFTAASANATLKVDGSNDGSSWTTLYSSAFSNFIGSKTITSSDGLVSTTAYRYHRVTVQDTSGSGYYPKLSEVYFYEEQALGGGSSQWTTASNNIYYNTGNVGVGTASPGTLLDVNGVARIGGATASYGQLRVKAGTSGNAYALWAEANSAQEAITLLPGNPHRIQIDYSGVGVARDLAFNMGGSEWMRLTTAGNVGIGTTALGTKLEVNGNIKTTSDINVYGANSGSAPNRIALTMEGAGVGRILVNGPDIPTRGTFKIDLANSSGTVITALAADANGNVGIGTTSPGANMDILRPSTCCSPASASGDGATLRLTGPSPTMEYYENDSGAFWLANHLSGDQMYWYRWTGTWTQLMTLNNAGYLWTAGGGVWSDARMKKDVTPLNEKYGLDAIMALRPVTFRWKDKSLGTNTHIGLIAQETEKVIPELVSSDEVKDINGKVTGERKGIEYSSLTVPLIKAVQELKADNDNLRADLKAANDNYTAQIRDLRQQLEALKADR